MELMDYGPAPSAWELACDEALLEGRESGATAAEGILRFWEPTSTFVVLGYSNRAAQEVDLEAAEAAQVPILRRCTGGGSVLQGPGCLNYSLLLPVAGRPDLASITQTNCFIMRRHRDALATLLGKPVAVEGYTDLAVGGRKFSGNSQRRKQRWLLFHGTFLLDCDLELMQRILRLPARQPDYRQKRTHAEFLTTVDVKAFDLKQALGNIWQVDSVFDAAPETRIKALVASKYSRREWNFRL